MAVLRFASPGDAEEILSIYRPYVENTSITFETELPSVAEFSGRISDTLRMFPYLVLEEDGKILGYAYAHAFRERAAYDWTVETSIYLREECRGDRRGRRLYGALLPLLKAQGVCHVCAVVTVPNERSVRFHQRMGFEYLCTMPDCGYKAGAWHGTAYLYCTLKSAEEAPAPLIPVGELDKTYVQEVLKNS